MAAVALRLPTAGPTWPLARWPAIPQGEEAAADNKADDYFAEEVEDADAEKTSAAAGADDDVPDVADLSHADTAADNDGGARGDRHSRSLMSTCLGPGAAGVD